MYKDKPKNSIDSIFLRLKCYYHITIAFISTTNSMLHQSRVMNKKVSFFGSKHPSFYQNDRKCLIYRMKVW